MITYAERVCFKPRHLDMLRRAADLVARVSPSWGNELRCHELARAVSTVLQTTTGRLDYHDVRLYDGKCGPVEHTWLEFGDDGVILDVYAPGRLPAVQLVDPIVAATLYTSRTIREDIRGDVIARLCKEMRA